MLHRFEMYRFLESQLGGKTACVIDGRGDSQTFLWANLNTRVVHGLNFFPVEKTRSVQNIVIDYFPITPSNVETVVGRKMSPYFKAAEQSQIEIVFTARESYDLRFWISSIVLNWGIKPLPPCTDARHFFPYIEWDTVDDVSSLEYLSTREAATEMKELQLEGTFKTWYVRDGNDW